MSDVKFLGIGSAFNTKLGNTSAYIEDGEELILIDCGSTVFQELIKRNIIQNKKSINIFITHMHTDHIGSLSTLIEYCFYILKIKANIYFDDCSKMEAYLSLSLIDRNLYNIILDDYDILSHHIIYRSKVHHFKNNLSNVYTIINTENENKYIFCWDTTDCYLDEFINRVLDEKPNTIIYHDCCSKDYFDNAHCYCKKLLTIEPKNRDKVYLVHLDDYKVLNKFAKNSGFKIPEFK